MGALSMTKKVYALDNTADLITKVVKKSKDEIELSNKGVTYLRRQTKTPAESSEHFLDKLDDIIRNAEDVKAEAQAVIDNVESFKRWIKKVEEIRTWDIFL